MSRVEFKKCLHHLALLLSLKITLPKKHSKWAPVGPNWAPFGNAAWVCPMLILRNVMYLDP